MTQARSALILSMLAVAVLNLLIGSNPWHSLVYAGIGVAVFVYAAAAEADHQQTRRKR